MSFRTNIEFDSEQDRWVVKAKGDLDIYTSNEFKDLVLDAFENMELDLLIDGTNLDYIDSTGLGALISIFKVVNSKDKKIYISNLKSNIRKLFDITELDKLFIIRGEDNA